MINKFSKNIENKNPKRKIKNVYNFLFSIIARPLLKPKIYLCNRFICVYSDFRNNNFLHI
jgi:hypothetical protein